MNFAEPANPPAADEPSGADLRDRIPASSSADQAGRAFDYMDEELEEVMTPGEAPAPSPEIVTDSPGPASLD